MADDDHEPEPTQKTPTGHPIPVPTREAVLGDLAKTWPPAPSPKPKRKSKRRKSG
jgi:hypothetical protein